MSHSQILKLAQKFSKKLCLAEDSNSNETMNNFIFEFHKSLLSNINALGGELFSISELQKSEKDNPKQYNIIKIIKDLMKDVYTDLRHILRNASEHESYGGAEKFIDYINQRSTIEKFENIEFFIKHAIKQKILVLSLKQLKMLSNQSQKFINDNPIVLPHNMELSFSPETRLNSDNETGVQVPKPFKN